MREGNYEEAIAAVEGLLGVDAPDRVREARVLAADCRRYLKQCDEAIESYERLLAENSTDRIAVSCLAGLADCLLQTGELGRAEAAMDKALAMYPEVTDAALAARGSSFYSRNRAQYESAVDFARGQLSKLASAYLKAGHDTAALLTYGKLYLTYPHHPGAPDIALKVGDLLRERRSHEWAIPFYLAVLDASGDRCYSDQAELSVNQRYLDVVAKPPPLARIEAAFAGLNACLAESTPERCIASEVVGRVAEAWLRAVGETYRPFSDEWAARWRSIADRLPEPPWPELCWLAIGQSLIRDGYYSEAIETLSALEVTGPAAKALRQRSHCALAEAHLGSRHFDQTRRYAQGAACGPDRVVASEAMLLLGRAAECELDFAVARRAYCVAASESCVERDRREAEHALGRITTLSETNLAQSDAFSVLPDDRTTRGYWPLGYGRNQYVLCAHNYYFDFTGGSGPKLQYSFRTTDPEEPSRLWVTARSDDDPAALWAPAVRAGRPANRDDYGEQTPIGSGPDLICDLEVPAGAYILSLYFVNDHNYYEPNRRYTVSVTGGEGGLLAVTEVESFGGGVYKRFALRGPWALSVHIWRNLSMNTLLQGVFLDGIAAPTEPPHRGALSSCHQVRQTQERYRTLCRSFLSDPVRAAAGLAALEEAVAHAKAARHGAEAGDLPYHDWMVAECLRVRGDHRRADAEFDRYLSDVARAVQPSELPETYDAIGCELITRAGQGSDLNAALLRRRVHRDGAHRWDRVYSAYFAALQQQRGDDPDKLASQLMSVAARKARYPTTFVAEMAYDLLDADFPERLTAPDALYARAQVYDRTDQPKEGIAVLRELLQEDITAHLRRDATYLLLRLQVNAGVNPVEAERTYGMLAEFASHDSRELRTGLYLLGLAHYQAGEYSEASTRLREYQSAYGSRPSVKRLLAECQQREEGEH